jgi:hypothetical protein
MTGQLKRNYGKMTVMKCHPRRPFESLTLSTVFPALLFRCTSFPLHSLHFPPKVLCERRGAIQIRRNLKFFLG